MKWINDLIVPLASVGGSIGLKSNPKIPLQVGLSIRPMTFPFFRVSIDHGCCPELTLIVEFNCIFFNIQGWMATVRWQTTFGCMLTVVLAE